MNLAEAAGQLGAQTVEEYLDGFLAEKANASLMRTPELLAVLKQAGVVDSGGAGLIRVVQGMRRSLDDDFDAAVVDAPENRNRKTRSRKI